MGLGGIPKIDLSFTGAKEFVFAFTDVIFQAVDPAVLDGTLQNLSIPLAIPDSYIEFGGLHIAYEYAYANALTMTRSDGEKFDAGVSGDLATYIDIGAKGSVELRSDNTVSFSSRSGEVAAFAYKAGQLNKHEDRWTFEPEVVKRTRKKTGKLSGKPFLPTRTVVLVAEDE